MLLHSIAKSAVKSVFSLHPLPVISTPKPPFFVRFGHFWGKIHLFRGVLLFSSREILAQNLCFRRKNQFDGVFLFGIRPNFDFCRRGKRGKQALFSPSPTPFEKYKPTFSQNFSTFRDFLPCFSQNLPTPHKIPFTPMRRTRAYAYIRACALSDFAIFAFTLHLTAQQTVYQSIECEGKPCIHLHIHRNNLIYNTLHDIRCKKSVKAKG